MVEEEVQDERLFSCNAPPRVIFTSSSNVLSLDYVPTKKSEIIGRDKEIEDIVAILNTVMFARKPSNIFIYGKPGTGKTLLARYVSNKLAKEASENKINVKIIYENGKNKTSLKIIWDIINQVSSNKVNMRGSDAGTYWNRFWDLIDNINGHVIVILDEIDTLKDQDILYGLTRATESGSLKSSKINFIALTNNTHFPGFIDPRIMSSLSAEELIFPPYDANQLRKILDSKASIAFHPGVLSESVIPLCAAYSAQEHGDARKAVNLLRIAGELAERENASVVTEDHVKKARDKTEQDRISEVLRTLPTQSKLAMYACITLLESNDRKKHGDITTGDIYSKYKKFCNLIGMDVLTARRVTELIDELAMLGMIYCRVSSKGRYGRTRTIDPAVDLNHAKIVLLEDYRLQHFSDDGNREDGHNCDVISKKISEF
jgi:cell division control protein 6